MGILSKKCILDSNLVRPPKCRSNSSRATCCWPAVPIIEYKFFYCGIVNPVHKMKLTCTFGSYFKGHVFLAAVVGKHSNVQAWCQQVQFPIFICPKESQAFHTQMEKSGPCALFMCIKFTNWSQSTRLSCDLLLNKWGRFSNGQPFWQACHKSSLKYETGLRLPGALM